MAGFFWRLFGADRRVRAASAGIGGASSGLVSPSQELSTERIVMVSVLCETTSPLPFLKSRGFKSLQALPHSLRFDMEIAGGYYSYLRGDEDSNSREPSVFAGNRESLNGLNPKEIVQRDRVIVAMGSHKSQKQSASRAVLCVIGPESQVRRTIEDDLLERKEGSSAEFVGS